MSQYFLGIDAGQSGTTAIIGDESGRVLGVGRGAPSNQGGEAGFLQSIAAILHQAHSQAGLDKGVTHFSGACGGFSGGPAGKQAVLSQIVTSEHWLLTDDATIALSGALAGQPGIVVIGGTGSIAHGRSAQSRTARAGGWGYLFGDEGGGFWIVREAMRAALRFEEGWGAPTSLRAILLDASGSRNMNHFMHRCYTPEFPRPRVASFSFQVNTAAESGDPIAIRILQDAARELGLLAKAIRAQLFADGESVHCAYVGGVFHSRILLGSFCEILNIHSGLVPRAPLQPPAVGALLEAYRVAGVIPTQPVSRF
jgi:N-acetylglucosamine kinase-like BadF-type ATPase